MCVSTAYRDSENGEVVAEHVVSIRQQDGTIVMTDIMGRETEVRGALRSADFTRGVLIMDGGE